MFVEMPRLEGIETSSCGPGGETLTSFVEMPRLEGIETWDYNL